jgi:hypothetical protein
MVRDIQKARKKTPNREIKVEKMMTRLALGIYLSSQFQNVWGNTTSAHQSRAMFFEN